MLIGHQKQWDFLTKAFESEKLSHAFIFSGADQLGKKSLAKEFVKLINCQNKKDKPCGFCTSCKSIEINNYPDFLTVESEGEIQISQIRQVQNFLSYKSYYGSFKSVVIDNAEKMNQEAQSCFLKTLEEPKGKTILILVSSQPEALLSTIASRCQTIKFYPVNQKDIKEHLIKIGAKPQLADMLSDISFRKPGRAVDFFLNPEKLVAEKKKIEEIVKVVSSDLAEKFKYAKKVDSEEYNMKEIIELLQKYLRHLIFLKTNIEDLKEQSYYPVNKGKIESYPIEKIKDILEFSENIIKQISSTNANARLALEVLLMQI